MQAATTCGRAKRSAGGLSLDRSGLGRTQSHPGLGLPNATCRHIQRPSAATVAQPAAALTLARRRFGQAHAASSSSSLVWLPCSTRAGTLLLPGGGHVTDTSRAASRRAWRGTLAHARPRRRAVLVSASWPGLGSQRSTDPGRLFVFGLGYTGLGAATYFQQRGWSVAGTCRCPDKRRQLDARGLTAFHFDPAESCYLDGKALDCLRGATHVLSTVPPEAGSGSEVDPVVQAHAQQLCEHAARYRWVGYVSSTSVYGDYEGDWVDERSELRAAGGKGWSRVVAEHEWLALHDSFGLPVHIFRCGGIYGPRRSALETVRREEAAGQWQPSASQERRAGQRFTARCHVLDICRVLEASMRRPAPGQAYNVADDDPADRSTVMRYAAGLLQRRTDGQPLGGREEAPPSSGWAWGSSADEQVGGNGVRGAVSARSFGGDDAAEPATAASSVRREGTRSRVRAAASGAGQRLEEKRVRNVRIKEELGVQLQFPTYREGLAAIAAGDLRPFE